MSDLVSRLLVEIEAKEAKARRADESEWYSVHVSDADVEAFWEDNKPAAVLRRCAADRRQVARHHSEPRSGHNPDDDDTPGAYGTIREACAECGSDDQAVRWPCPTLLDVADAYGINAEAS